MMLNERIEEMSSRKETGCDDASGGSGWFPLPSGCRRAIQGIQDMHWQWEMVVVVGIGVVVDALVGESLRCGCEVFWTEVVCLWFGW